MKKNINYQQKLSKETSELLEVIAELNKEQDIEVNKRRFFEYIQIEHLSMKEIYEQHIKAIYEVAFSKDIQTIFKKMFLRLDEYSYQNYLFRKSLHSKYPMYLKERVLDFALASHINYNDFDILNYLKGLEDDFYDCSESTKFIIESMIAQYIDDGDDKVIQTLKDIINGEINEINCNYVMLIGIIKSRNSDLYNEVINLLDETNINQGLLQIILEAANKGTIDYFKLIIRKFIDLDLTRFTTCTSAINNWVGFGYYTDNKRYIKIIIELIDKYLNDESMRKVVLDTNNPLELYLSLWATSVYEMCDAMKLADTYLKGNKLQKLVAAHFLKQLCDPLMSTTSVINYIDEDDLDVFAYYFECVVVSDIHLYDLKKQEIKQSIKDHLNIVSQKQQQLLFDIYAKKVCTIPKDSYKVFGKPFPWSRLYFNREELLRSMLYLCILNKTNENVDKIIELASIAKASIRVKIIRYMLDANDKRDKQALFAYLDDKNADVKEAALKELIKISLSDEEIIKISELLRLKTAGIRGTIIELITSQKINQQKKIIQMLLKDKLVSKRLAALDLLLKMHKDDKNHETFIKESVLLIDKPTHEEFILIYQLIKEGAKEEYTKENGYGLYDPKQSPTFKYSYHDTKTIESFISVPIIRLIEIYKIFSNFIKEYKDYKFEVPYNKRNHGQMIFGRLYKWVVPFDKGITNSDAPFEDYVLSDKVETLILENRIQPMELLRIMHLNQIGNPSYYEDYTKLFKIEDLNDYYKLCKDITYNELITNILKKYTILKLENEVFAITSNILSDFICRYKDKDIFIQDIREVDQFEYPLNNLQLLSATEVSFFVGLKGSTHKNIDNFKKSVALSYKLASLQNDVCIGLDVLDIARAVAEGILPINELYRTFFEEDTLQKISDYSNKDSWRVKDQFKQYPILETVVENIVNRIFKIEVKRADSATNVSKMALAIRAHYGVKHFVKILIALGKEGFAHGRMYGSKTTKKDVLSSLLKTCYPLASDRQEYFNQSVEGVIRDKRLIEAVMYAPAWAAYLENYLGWNGLKSAVWYFHAHSNEFATSLECESEVAMYSPISMLDFRNGALDFNWYFNIHKMLGRDMFDLFLKSAKYISTGSSYRRVKFIVDTAQSSLNARTLEKEIMEKRNKDMVLSYGLLPLPKNVENEVSRRYEFICKFLKKSKEFEKSKREREKKASQFVLTTLAQSLGYEDTNIFIWRMECAKLEEISKYFESKQIGIYEVALEIDEEGSSSILVVSDGKQLEKIPPELKKDKYILELIAVRNSLNDQYICAIKSFENAMIDRTSFVYEDVIAFTYHPVINAIMKKLVFICEDKFGFIKDGEFVDDKGRNTVLDKKALLYVVHPYDLMIYNVCSDYQKYIFEAGIVQPFKQVFRELYTLNMDEKESNAIARRYVGQQILPRKSATFLKNRGWKVYYEEGLQKVNFKYNIISRMYAKADWIYPDDAETTILETVEFFDRKTREHIAFDTIDPIIFSETIRDIDLVVSLAHVGGVDVEASHSTIEIRRVLVKETLRLMKINNVTFSDEFVKVKGHYGEYNIHLGSGQIQMHTKGNIHILAVQSQQKDKTFLPFLDEDSHIKEIVSKVVLLANDTKIKDPMILEQIK